jgi:hypothetical protein
VIDVVFFSVITRLLLSSFNFIWVVPVTVTYGPEQIFQSEDNLAISLNLVNVSHLVSYQRLIIEMLWV